ncbi:MAG: hypothetical protein ACKO2P_14880 [Planctomycetota bacterium]
MHRHFALLPPPGPKPSSNALEDNETDDINLKSRTWKQLLSAASGSNTAVSD